MRIHATAEVGEIELPNGIGGDGRNVESELIETGERVLVIDARVGAGQVARRPRRTMTPDAAAHVRPQH